VWAVINIVRKGVEIRHHGASCYYIEVEVIRPVLVGKVIPSGFVLRREKERDRERVAAATLVYYAG